MVKLRRGGMTQELGGEGGSDPMDDSFIKPYEVSASKGQLTIGGNTLDEGGQHRLDLLLRVEVALASMSDFAFVEAIARSNAVNVDAEYYIPLSKLSPAQRERLGAFLVTIKDHIKVGFCESTVDP